jgi:hypothetical protein
MNPHDVHLQPMKLVTIMAKFITLWAHFTTGKIKHVTKKEVQWTVVITVLKAQGRDF